MFYPYNTLEVGFRLSDVRAQYFVPLVLHHLCGQGRTLFCPYNTMEVGFRLSDVRA